MDEEEEEEEEGKLLEINQKELFIGVEKLNVSSLQTKYNINAKKPN